MIERIYIHNFRCLENFTLNLAGLPSALIIGKNGSGKSTLRAALGVFQAICRRSSRVRDLIAETDFNRLDGVPMRFEIEVRLGDQLFAYSISFEWPSKFREARVASESLMVDGVSIFTRQQAQVTLGTGATFGLDWHVAALPVIDGRPGEDWVSRIRLFFAQMILIAPIPTQMTGFSEDESSELSSDAGNFSSWLNDLILKRPAIYGRIAEYLNSVMQDFSAFENVMRGESGKQLVIKFAKDGTGGEITLEFRQLSDGEKCLFWVP